MRLDIHTHIFTLRCILTNEATRVMTERLRHRGCPEFLVKAIEEAFQDLLDRPQYLDERHLLQLLIRKITGGVDFGEAIGKHLSTDWLEVTIGADLTAKSADALSEILTRIADAYDGGGKSKTIVNVIQTLRVSMRNTITEVADEILEGMSDDEVIVALMMDVYGPSEPARDARAYRDQIQGTADAAVQRPGRILPFFGVHPDRPGHLDALRDAVENRGFVGVKLYPSLGYRVDSPTMRHVYEYCVQKDLPVLLHCGHGGFFRTEEARGYCDPAQWTEVLAAPGFSKLRVCFAHFGGWEAMGRRECFGFDGWDDARDREENWGKKIRDFMLKYPNVYTDLAKHVGMFERPDDTQTYFAVMRELIGDPKIGRRILYGSDAWLLRLDMPFEEYRTRWREAAGDSMGDIAEEGPRTFLGFPSAGTALPSNLARYVSHMRANRHRFGREPAPWLREHLTEPYTVVDCPPDWNFDRLAVRDTYQFLGQYLTDQQAEQGHVRNRLIRLKELPYFDKADPNFGGRCRDMARRFIDFADQDMQYAPGHSFGSAVDLFVDIFREGELRFCDVARMLDTVIDYPEAIA